MKIPIAYVDIAAVAAEEVAEVVVMRVVEVLI
jgi:hypothetical protein